MAELEHLLTLRPLLRNVRSTDGTIAGMVTVDQHVVRLFDELADAGLNLSRGSVLVTPGELRPGDVVEVSIDGTVHNFYETVDLFLRHFPTREPSGVFHVHELNFTSSQDSLPVPIRRYREAIRLWNLLAEIADHADGDRLYLLSSDKLEIEARYAIRDLSDLTHLPKLAADFAADAPGRDEKEIILKRALQSELGKVDASERFGVLLRNFSSVYDRYWQNLRLYLQNIDFDKIFEGYVEKHSKLITEFNSVLGSIQTALIGLPIASFVILEKMTIAPHPSFKNTVLVCGCIVFTLFLAVLSLSQGRTLSASKALMRELGDEIGKKSPDLAAKLQPSLERLSRHSGWVTALLVLVRILLVGLLLVSLLTYAYVSFPSLRQKITVMLQALVS